MKRLSKFSFTCKPDEVNEAILKLLYEYASYEGYPVDDWHEYVSSKSGVKIVEVMTPVGERLFFKITPSTSGDLYVCLLASSWSGLGEL